MNRDYTPVLTFFERAGIGTRGGSLMTLGAYSLILETIMVILRDEPPRVLAVNYFDPLFGWKMGCQSRDCRDTLRLSTTEAGRHSVVTAH